MYLRILGPGAVFCGFGPKVSLMRRLACALLVLWSVAFPAAPAAAARRVAPVTILVAANVAEAARRTMSPELWARLVSDYVSASKVVQFSGAAAPTREDCRAAGAAYAVNATFELMPRLPGLAQDTDRKYGLARIDLLNCITGTATPTHVVRLESDPLSRANEGDFEPNVEITWARAVRDRLGREPLELTGVARITRVDGPFVYIDGLNTNFTVNQVLRDFADKDTRPRPELELVISDINGKVIQAVWNPQAPGVVPPKAGDYVEPARAVSPAAPDAKK
ncbi:MAG: hypothetical protein NVS3B28_30100 [Candidatus Velthaea sp.]